MLPVSNLPQVDNVCECAGGRAQESADDRRPYTRTTQTKYVSNPGKKYSPGSIGSLSVALNGVPLSSAQGELAWTTGYRPSEVSYRDIRSRLFLALSRLPVRKSHPSNQTGVRGSKTERDRRPGCKEACRIGGFGLEDNHNLGVRHTLGRAYAASTDFVTSTGEGPWIKKAIRV